MRYLMKCGHIAQGTANEKPVCVICFPQSKLGEEIAKEVEGDEGLEGRQAQCWDCNKIRPSSWGLAFFEYRPQCQYDSFYCGCGGWD